MKKLMFFTLLFTSFLAHAEDKSYEVAQELASRNVVCQNEMSTMEWLLSVGDPSAINENALNSALAVFQDCVTTVRNALVTELYTLTPDEIFTHLFDLKLVCKNELAAITAALSQREIDQEAVTALGELYHSCNATAIEVISSF